LDPAQIGLLADWLRGDWYEPAEAAGNTKDQTPSSR